MPFDPNIIVTRDETLDLTLVVEASLEIEDLGALEAQLKRYMFGMRCPVGMLITPSTMYLYEDRALQWSPASIERVGDFPIAGLIDVGGAVTAPSPSEAKAKSFRFESAVQTWLEHLAEGADLANLPPDLREAIEEHVLPAIQNGDIRAGRPRG